jgi:hypothetical protein
MADLVEPSREKWHALTQSGARRWQLLQWEAGPRCGDVSGPHAGDAECGASR